jgi:hypothetical protein
MRGLDWQPLHIPFAAGVNQQADDRALPPPALAAAIDVQFDEVGGLQTRKPFLALGADTATGGTISTARRIVANGSEKVLFTKDSVFTWNDQLDRWVFRATHLAVTTEERTTFATTGDQYDCDRAELNGLIFYVWCDSDRVYLAVREKATGAIILAPTVGGAAVATRPRIIALATVVVIAFHSGTDAIPGEISGLALSAATTDPAGWASSFGGAPAAIVAAASAGTYFDLVKNPAADQGVLVARRTPTTSYELVKIANDLSLTAATKARTCDGPIAVAVDPTGTSIQIIRANGTNIQGDRLTLSSLADAATGQAVGTVSSGPVNHVTCAYRSTTDGGFYRCYAFWTRDEETGAGAWECSSNYVDTNGALGTAATFVRRLGLASRAFGYDGRVYVWGAFAGESSFSGASPSAFRSALQNTYFLYRDDATLHAKCAAGRGGGLAPSIGRLPGVALTAGSTTFSWCATERRIIAIGSSGKQSGYDARAPRDVLFTFDSNGARRCARLGETLYVSGSEVLQYDGVGLYEVGFHVYPWYFGLVEVAAGSLTDGTYTYKVTARAENARGELDRSTTATHGDVTIASGPNGASIVSWPPIYITRRTNIAIEVWRTAVNPGDGAPFFLVSAKDPSDTTNPNRYVANDTTASSLPTFNDEMDDATARTKETNPENGDVLENLAPPGATLIVATDTRVFLGNVSGDPDRVWYSKLRQSGQVVSFNDTLAVDVPGDGGAMTGLGILNGLLVVFRERAVYMFPGDGYDNTGRGTNYGPPQVISIDVGCRDTDSIATTPEGLVFQSSKGKYLLTRGWTVKPIGLTVVDYDSEAVLATHVVSAQHQVRWLTASRLLVWDYLVDQWSEWSVAGGLHAALWGGTYHYLVAAGPLAEQASYSSGVAYGLDVETAWIKPADLQGAVSFRKLQALGEFRSAFTLWIRVAYDYRTTWVDERFWVAVPAVAGRPLQIEIRPSRQKLQAVKLRLTAVGTVTQATMSTTGVVPLQDFMEFPPTFWSATFTAIPIGPLGNGITLTIGVISGSDTLIEVRDHQIWDAATNTWSVDTNNVGVKVTYAGPVSITAVQDAINADSQLLDVTTPHPTAALLDMSGFGGVTLNVETDGTSGGAVAAPSGESLKLTGLGLEVGLTPRLHKRFPRGG